MRKYQAVPLFVLMALLIFFSPGCSKTTTTASGPAKTQVMVDAAQVKTGTLSLSNTVNGKLEALNSANVVAKSSGKVADIAVDVGSSVAAGQVLISLESDDLAAALRLAEAGVETAQINYDLAQKQFERGRELHDAGAISQSDFDVNYQAALDKARIALKSAQATQDQQQAKYNDSFIKSPLDGVVTTRNINVGEQAGSASTLITVMNLDKVIVNINVLEDQVNRLHVGQQVEVKVSAVSDTPFTGAITNIASAASTSSKVFPVKVHIDNRDHVLKPGMFAEVTFTVTGKTGLLVPNTAVTSYNGSQKVFLIKEDIARDTPVVAGESDSQYTLIVSGVSEGDEVIINGTDAALKDGVGVKRKTAQ